MWSPARRVGSALVAGAALAAWPLTGVTPADEKARPLPTVRFPFGEDEAKRSRDDYAKAAGRPKEFTNGVGMRMVLIPPGTFEMGPGGSKYRVTLARPF